MHFYGMTVPLEYYLVSLFNIPYEKKRKFMARENFDEFGKMILTCQNILVQLLERINAQYDTSIDQYMHCTVCV